MSENEQSYVISPVARLAWPNLFEAKTIADGNQEFFSATFIFEEGVDLSELKAVAYECGVEKFGKDQFDKMLKDGTVTTPFRHNAEAKGYPEGSVYINTKSRFQPGVIDRYADPATGEAREITDAGEMYPGVQVKAKLTPYAYEHMGNKGVSFGLDGVQRWADAERLDGRMSVADSFEVEMPAETDLSDVEGEALSEEPAAAGAGADNDLSALM